MKTEYSRKQQGFTFVEMLVAVATGALVMIVILLSFSALSVSLAASEHFRNMHHDVRHAMLILERDITRGSNVSEHIATNRLKITTAAAGSVTGSVDVIYNFAGNMLFRTEGGTTETLASGVEEVLFTLYNQSGVTTAVPEEAYFVGAEMRMERQGIRDSYTDRLLIRSRMRTKGL